MGGNAVATPQTLETVQHTHTDCYKSPSQLYWSLDVEIQVCIIPLYQLRTYVVQTNDQHQSHNVEPRSWLPVSRRMVRAAVLYKYHYIVFLYKQKALVFEAGRKLTSLTRSLMAETLGAPHTVFLNSISDLRAFYSRRTLPP